MFTKIEELKNGDWVEFVRGEETEKARIVDISYYAGLPMLTLETAKKVFLISCSIVVENVRKVGK